MVTDRVGDFIIRLQNAVMVGKKEVSLPHSSHLVAIAHKLKQLGFLTTVKVEGEAGAKRFIVVTLSYDERGHVALRGVKRISKPGRRLYAPSTAIHKVKGGTGARLVSTSKGILSDAEARKGHVGGEDLFEIW